MDNRVGITEFLSHIQNIPLLDVRSPKEFSQGHIPSAISLPLFSDEERAIVGTLYKNEGKQKAIKKGIEFVGPKMLYFINEVEALDTGTVALYCWRGGMRSQGMSWLFEQYGLKTLVLEGGYKTFRKSLLNFFNKQLPLRIITGFTGSKKTELLSKIKEKGGQVIDLEGLANHQGSSYGNQKSDSQPSTEQFQNFIYHQFRQLDTSRPIYLEDECHRIGQVNLIESLFHQMRNSQHILIEVDKSERVDFLVSDYGMLTTRQLISATESIKKKLGFDQAKKAIEFIRSGNLKRATEIILTYYDRRYQMSIAEKQALISHRYKINIAELDSLAAEIIGHEI